jgi:hypothetical protein
MSERWLDGSWPDPNLRNGFGRRSLSDCSLGRWSFRQGRWSRGRQSALQLFDLFFQAEDARGYVAPVLRVFLMVGGGATAQIEDGHDQPDRQDDGHTADCQDDKDGDAFH